MAIRLETSGDELRLVDFPSSGDCTVTWWSYYEGGGTASWASHGVTFGNSGAIDGVYLEENNGANNLSLWIIQANTAQAQPQVLSGFYTATGPWYFWCLTWDVSASTAVAYYREAGDTSLTSQSASGSGSWTIDRFWINDTMYGGEWSDTTIEAVKIWDRVLTEDEIMAESHFNAPVNMNGLWCWLPLHDTTYETVDHSGNGRNWSAFGTPGPVDTTRAAPIPYSPRLYLPKRLVYPTTGVDVAELNELFPTSAIMHSWHVDDSTGPIAKAGTDTSGAASATNPITFNHTQVAGADRMIVVAVSAEGREVSGQGVTYTITYGGTSMTKIADALIDNGASPNISQRNMIYVLKESQLGSDGLKTVSIGHSKGTDFLEFKGWCGQYNNVDQIGYPSGSDIQTATASDSSATITHTFAGGVDTDYYISSASFGAANTITWGGDEFVVETLEETTLTSTLGVSEVASKALIGDITMTPSTTTNRICTAAVRFRLSTSPAAPAGAGTQNINATGLDASVAFGTPTVDSTVDIAPTGLSATPSFGTPGVSFLVSPGGLDSSVSFGAPTLDSTYDIQPTGLSVTPSFGSPTVSSTYDITPASLVAAPTFGDPTLDSTYDIQATGLSVTPSFGSPAVANIIKPASLVASPTFGDPTLSSTVDIAPASLVASPTFGSPDVANVIQPTGYAVPTTFGAPTVAPGAVDITTTSLVATPTFGAPTVESGFTIEATGLDASVTFGTPKFTMDIKPSSLVASPTFGSPTVEHATQDIAPSGLVASPTFGSPAVANVIQPTGYAIPTTFGTPTIGAGSVNITTTSLVTTPTFGTPTVVSGYNISATSLDASASFGTPTVEITTQDISPSSLIVSPTFGSPAVANVIQPTGYAVPTTFGAPTVAPGAVDITATGHDASVTFGAPKFTIDIAATGFSVAPTFGAPTVAPGAVDITATGYAVPITFGTPTVVSGINVAPTGHDASVTFGAPTLGTGAVNITTSGLVANPTFGSPAVANIVAPTGLAAGVSFGTVTLSATVDISPSGYIASAIFGTPTIGSQGTVSPTGLSAAPQFGTPGLSSIVDVSPTGYGIPTTFGVPTLSSTADINPAGMSVSPTFGPSSRARPILIAILDSRSIVIRPIEATQIKRKVKLT